MPLEQIRPALRLEPERPRRYASLLDYSDSSPPRSPEEELGRHEWVQDPFGGLRRTPSIRKAEEMNLAKLGGVGGVTRSGSWGRNSIAPGPSSSKGDAMFSPSPRKTKLCRPPHSLSEEDDAEYQLYEPAGVDPEFSGRRPVCSIGGSTTSEAPSTSSRASTSSSSAAAFSLRSLSNRDSTGSVSSTASSVASVGALSEGSSHVSETESTASPATPCEDGASETTALGESRIECDSISDGTDVPQNEGPPSHSADANSTAEEVPPSSGSEAVRRSEAWRPSDASPHQASQFSSPVSPTQTDHMGSSDSPLRENRPESSSPSQGGRSGQAKSPRRPLNRRVPSADATSLSRMMAISPPDAGLAAAGQALAVPVGPDAMMHLPAPRRHSGMFMLRSRSQLVSHAGLQMSFANGGQGRAAARERSRQPQEWENAPFSVLEARGHTATTEAVGAPASPRLTPLTTGSERARRKSGFPSASRFAALTPLARSETVNAIGSGRTSPAIGSAGRSSPDLPYGQTPGGSSRPAPLSLSSAAGTRPALSRSPSVHGTNVFRTPTIEEWSRFLESQGLTLPSGRHSRTATNFSAASAHQLAARLGSSGVLVGPAQSADPDSGEDQDSEDSDDDLTAGVLEKLRQLGLSRAASRAGSVIGEDLSSLHEDEEEDLSSPETAALPPNLSLATSIPTLGPRRDSSLSSSGFSESPADHGPLDATPQPTPDRAQSGRSPTAKRLPRDVPAVPVPYNHGEQGQKTINDYVVQSEIGRGAYGLVKQARVKGEDGRPTGDEVVIKYIIKSRILADCWRRHRSLGPIPIEIHVMDQLRRLPYHPPRTPLPWSPYRARTAEEARRRKVSKEHEAASHTECEEGLPPARPALASPLPADTNSHPNLCRMLDFFEDHEFYYMVMPRFGTGQDLFDHVESAPNGLDTFEIRSILGQVADALRFLHANNIVHRDIKDENVILDGDGNVQLIDFGSAAHVRPGRLFDTFSGTLDYAAAEILRGEKYAGQAQDVWALGVVGFVLLCGECPFWNGEEAIEGLVEGSRAEQTLRERNMLAHADGAQQELASLDDPTEASVDPATWNIDRTRMHAEPDGGGRLDDVVDLIARCLEVEPTFRPTTSQICRHRFLAGQGGWTGPQGWLDLLPERVSPQDASSQ